MALSPDFQEALLSEIAKVLPTLWRRAEAAVAAKAASQDAPSFDLPPARPRRLQKGRARQAVLKAVWAFNDKGASREEIRRMVPNFLHGQKLNEHTLKRWLLLLRQEDRIETHNGRWFPKGVTRPEGGPFRTTPRSKPFEEYTYDK
jgi:hypothetical protein